MGYSFFSSLLRFSRYSCCKRNAASGFAVLKSSFASMSLRIPLSPISHAVGPELMVHRTCLLVRTSQFVLTGLQIVWMQFPNRQSFLLRKRHVN